MSYNGDDYTSETDTFATSESETDVASAAAYLATSQGPAPSTTSSTSRSITSTFSTLDSHDVAFFDSLISTLALGDGSFASLKRAYEALRPQDEERDAHRWDLLLSLVRVQGRDWSERWDAVRLSLGMEMRGGDQSGVTAVESETSVDDADTVGGEVESDAATITGGEAQWTQEESQSEGSDGDQSSPGDYEVEEQQQPHWILPVSPPRNTSSAAASALRARLDALTHQASQLAIDAQGGSRSNGISRLLDTPPNESASPSSSSDPEPPISLAQRRMSAVLSNRESLRAAAQRRAEEGEEAAWSGSARLAQQHFERRLLAASFGWWAGQCEERRARLQRVGLARDTLVVGRSFHRWRSLAVDPQPDRAAVAVRANEARLLLSPWRAWRRKVTVARQARWEERKTAMKESYVVVKERRERREVEEAWRAWREALADRRSTTFRNGHLLGGAFYLWRIKQGVSKQLGTLLRQWQEAHPAEDPEEKLREAWELWSKRTSLEATGRAYERLRVQRRALGVWLQAVAEASMKKRRTVQAERQLERATLRAALGKWRRARQKGLQREEAAVAFRQEQDTALVSRILEAWKVNSRLSLWTRVKDAKQQMAALQAWRLRLQDVTIALPQRGALIIAKRNHTSLSRHFALWRQQLAAQRSASTLAQVHLSQRTLIAFFIQWRTTTQRHAENMERAVMVRDWFSQRSAFDAMRAHVRDAKAQRLTASHDRRLLSSTLSTWRQRASQQALDRLRVSQLQARFDEARTHSALTRWTQAVIERRALLLHVASVRDERLAAQALQRWRNAAQRVGELQSLCQSSLDVKRDESTRRVLHEWQRRARKHKAVRERGEQAVAEREAGILRGALERWHDAWRDQSLRDAEVKVLALRQQRVLGRALGKWVSKTKPIPALHFHGMRLKSMALRRWREALLPAMDARRAAEWHEEKLRGKALVYWWERAKARRGARAAERFGGSKVGMRLRRHSAKVAGGSPFVVRQARRSGGPEGNEERSASRASSSPRVAAAPSPTPSLHASHRRAYTPARPLSTASMGRAPRNDVNEDGEAPPTIPTFSSSSSNGYDDDARSSSSSRSTAALPRGILSARARSEILRPSSVPPPSSTHTLGGGASDDAATSTPRSSSRRLPYASPHTPRPARPQSVYSETAATTTPRATAWARAMKSAAAASGMGTMTPGRRGVDGGREDHEGVRGRGNSVGGSGSAEFLENLRRRRREMATTGGGD